jgi:hypothetical protein
MYKLNPVICILMFITLHTQNLFWHQRVKEVDTLFILFPYVLFNCQIINVNFSFVPVKLEVHIKYKLSIKVSTFHFYWV